MLQPAEAARRTRIPVTLLRVTLPTLLAKDKRSIGGRRLLAAVVGVALTFTTVLTVQAPARAGGPGPDSAAGVHVVPRIVDSETVTDPIVALPQAGSTLRVRYSSTSIHGLPTEMTGTLLTALPSRVESFERFLARTAGHEGVTVLVPTYASMRQYGANPYSRYDRSPKPFLYNGQLPENIAPLGRVVVVGKEAWSLKLLQRLKRIERGDLVITWEAGQNSALDTRMISMGRDIGNVVVQRDGPDGPADAVHDISFAFAFHAFHPEAPIHTEIE